MKCLYEVLGVDKQATGQEITTAYKNLARIHHPDKNLDKTEEATAKFQEIQQAYAVLNSSSLKQKYDAATSDEARELAVQLAIIELYQQLTSMLARAFSPSS